MLTNKSMNVRCATTLAHLINRKALFNIAVTISQKLFELLAILGRAVLGIYHDGCHQAGTVWTVE
jgi:hypothetical protein